MSQPLVPAEEVVIRPYRASDRAAVRQLCCDTADRGEPVEQFFPDREVFADLLTNYYIEYEPGSLWVAERPGSLIGYLTGCLDGRRYRRLMWQSIIPRAACRALIRGTWCSKPVWRLAQAAAATWRSSGLRLQPDLQGHPGHLHINLQHGFRGRGIGLKLIGQFLAQGRQAGVPGVTAAVRDDNPSACRVFEGLGFVLLHRHAVIFPEGDRLREHETRVYGKTL